MADDRVGRRAGDRATAGEKLVALIERELDHPRPFETIATELREMTPDSPELGRTLAALAEADRKRFWVKSQALWFSRFGWRLIRPMIAVGIVAAVVLYFAGTGDPSRDLLTFMLGVAALYVMLQIYAHRWAQQDEKKLAKAEDELRAKLNAILDDL